MVDKENMRNNQPEMAKWWPRGSLRQLKEVMWMKASVQELKATVLSVLLTVVLELTNIFLYGTSTWHTRWLTWPPCSVFPDASMCIPALSICSHALLPLSTQIKQAYPPRLFFGFTSSRKPPGRYFCSICYVNTFPSV